MRILVRSTAVRRAVGVRRGAGIPPYGGTTNRAHDLGYACLSRLRGIALAAVLLPALGASAAERAYYECTLQQALVNGKSVVFLFAAEGGRVRECGLKVPQEPGAICLVKEHALKVDGLRLSGPLQIQAGADGEKIDLDVALDRGGTWRRTWAAP